MPVVDLKDGIVVHARRGQRAGYAPLSSPLVEGCEPVAVARALCAVCRTSRLYVADLDALGGRPADEATLEGLASVAETWVDAGAITPVAAAALRARRRRAQCRGHRVPGPRGGGRPSRSPLRRSCSASICATDG